MITWSLINNVERVLLLVMINSLLKYMLQIPGILIKAIKSCFSENPFKIY